WLIQLHTIVILSAVSGVFAHACFTGAPSGTTITRSYRKSSTKFAVRKMANLVGKSRQVLKVWKPLLEVMNHWRSDLHGIVILSTVSAFQVFLPMPVSQVLQVVQPSLEAPESNIMLGAAVSKKCPLQNLLLGLRDGRRLKGSSSNCEERGGWQQATWMIWLEPYVKCENMYNKLGFHGGQACHITLFRVPQNSEKKPSLGCILLGNPSRKIITETNSYFRYINYICCVCRDHREINVAFGIMNSTKSSCQGKKKKLQRTNCDVKKQIAASCTIMAKLEVWHFYEERFGKLSEMPHSAYKLITAANMRHKRKGKCKKLNITSAEKLGV
ncbi:hypothetical protein MTR67_005634, partial [Solanum verrucosum]